MDSSAVADTLPRIYGLAFRHDVVLKLLEAPFLVFLTITVRLIVLRKELKALFARSEISIKWGDHSIELKDLSSNFDKELEPLRDDIEVLRQALSQNSSSARVLGVAQAPDEAGELAPIRAHLEQALRHSQFKWRSIERLSAIAGASEEQVLSLLRSDPDVRLSVGKSGRQIAGLRSRVGSE
jgi:hypothetical protein